MILQKSQGNPVAYHGAQFLRWHRRLAVHTDDPGMHPYIKGSPRFFVTAQGAAILAEHGRLPDISKDFIHDKVKRTNSQKSGNHPSGLVFSAVYHPSCNLSTSDLLGD